MPAEDVNAGTIAALLKLAVAIHCATIAADFNKNMVPMLRTVVDALEKFEEIK